MTEPPLISRLVITVRDLRFRYPGNSEDVLRVPFLDVPATGMTAITGPSGAGKSTLIELLAGTLREPYEGSVQVLGTEWRSLIRDADRQRQLRRIGLIPQDYGLLTNRTPAELLEQDLADAGTPKDERPARIRTAIAAVGLEPFMERSIAGLSGGQRQRVAIARMLARRVECVIADEPTANLDPALTAETMRVFRELARTIPVVIITHDPGVAEACNRTIVLQSAVAAPPAAHTPVPRKRSRRVLVGLGATGILAVAAVALVLTGAISLPAATPRAHGGTRPVRAHVLKTAHPRTHPPVSRPATDTRRRHPHATQVIVYEPWSVNGLARGIRAASTVSGYCWTDSLSTDRPDAYRCMNGNSLLDPCFASPYQSGAGQVACTYPSLRSVTIISLTKPLPQNPQLPPGQQPNPWLVILSNGMHCQVPTGTGLEVGGMPETFGCSNGASLFGNLRKTTPVWTIFYQSDGSSSMSLVQIAKAYE